MSVDFLYTILLLIAVMIFALCYLAHRRGCFSRRGWYYFTGFCIQLLMLGYYADYPANFFTSHASPTLQAKADSYLYLFDNMPSVPIRVVDDSTARDKKVAYFDPLRKSIFIRHEYLKRLEELNLDESLTETLKHEMVHAWMHWKGKDWEASRTHGSTFQAKLKEVLRDE